MSLISKLREICESILLQKAVNADGWSAKLVKVLRKGYDRNGGQKIENKKKHAFHIYHDLHESAEKTPPKKTTSFN